MLVGVLASYLYFKAFGEDISLLELLGFMAIGPLFLAFVLVIIGIYKGIHIVSLGCKFIKCLDSIKVFKK
jgi:hypothetical protein